MQDQRAIIHFIADSSYMESFITYIRDNYPEQEHIFYLITNSEPKYIKKNIDVVNIISGVLHTKIKQLRKLMAEHSGCLIFLHFLDRPKLLVLLMKDSSHSIYWKVWGADLYSRIEYEQYDKETKELIHWKKEKKNKFNKKLVHLIRKLLLKRIDYVGINDYEYKILNKFYSVTQSKTLLSYPITVEKKDSYGNLQINAAPHESGRRILLGNSGTPTNNHIAILKKLANLSCDFEVVVPLSYGDKDYINTIINEGKRLLGNKFIPITKFMDEEAYCNFLSTVDIAIFNHLRQQAVGNIRILVNLGKKIYLNPANVLYQQYHNLGIQIEDITASGFDESLFDVYEQDVYENNRRKMAKLYGKEEIKKKMDAIFLEGRI